MTAREGIDSHYKPCYNESHINQLLIWTTE